MTVLQALSQQEAYLYVAPPMRWTDGHMYVGRCMWSILVEKTTCMEMEERRKKAERFLLGDVCMAWLACPAVIQSQISLRKRYNVTMK